MCPILVLLSLSLRPNQADSEPLRAACADLLVVHVLAIALLHHLPLPALLLQGLLDELGHLALLPGLLPANQEPAADGENAHPHSERGNGRKQAHGGRRVQRQTIRRKLWFEKGCYLTARCDAGDLAN